MDESAAGLKSLPIAADEFRRYGHRIVDWIADYFDRIEDCPVLSPVEPNWLKDKLPAFSPEAGKDFGRVLDDIDRLILPAVTTGTIRTFTGCFRRRRRRSGYSARCSRRRSLRSIRVD